MFTVRPNLDADSLPGCDQTMRKRPGQWAVLWKHVNQQGMAGLDEAAELAELSNSSRAGVPGSGSQAAHAPRGITSPPGSQDTHSVHSPVSTGFF